MGSVGSCGTVDESSKRPVEHSPQGSLADLAAGLAADGSAEVIVALELPPPAPGDDPRLLAVEFIFGIMLREPQVQEESGQQTARQA
eukprot:Skav220015  [mRNA]  locus=scaffold947:358472:365699:+ [translate_table: standard]